MESRGTEFQVLPGPLALRSCHSARPHGDRSLLLGSFGAPSFAGIVPKSSAASSRCRNVLDDLASTTGMLAAEFWPGAGRWWPGDDCSPLPVGQRSRLHGWIPMAVAGTAAPTSENFPLPPPASGARRHSSRTRLRRQNSRPDGAQRCACPSPTSRGLRLCAVFPAMTDRHRNGAQPHKMERDYAQHR